MAETPNNDLEKQLRDYAQQRRDALGTPALHPANRATLQAEVKQRYGAATSASATPRSGWALFWPRFALAFTIVAILGVTAILLFPPGNKTKDNLTLAQLDQSQPVLGASDNVAVAPTMAPEPFAATATPTAPAAASAPARREIAAKSAVAAPAPTTYTIAKAERSDAPSARQESSRAFKGSASQNRPAGAPAKDSFGDVASVAARKPEEPTALFDSNTKAPSGSFSGYSAVTAGKSAHGGGEPSLQKQTALSVASLDGKDRASFSADKFDATKSKALNTAQTKVANEAFNNSAQRFYRNTAVTEELKKSGKLTVLDEFTVEQNGDTLTVVDRDGSVYNGFARLAGTERQNINAESGNPIQMVPNSSSGGRAGAVLSQNNMNRAPAQNQAPDQSVAAQNLGAVQSLQIQNPTEPQNYFFRVEGTNRSLNQRVVFSGNILQNNAAGVQTFNNSQAIRAQQNTVTGNQFNFNNRQSPVQNNFINGRVQLGNTKPTEFNALSADQ